MLYWDNLLVLSLTSKACSCMLLIGQCNLLPAKGGLLVAQSLLALSHYLLVSPARGYLSRSLAICCQLAALVAFLDLRV